MAFESGGRDSWKQLRPGLARGREQAFARLYDLLASPMLAVARRIVGSQADAEDAVHQTFLDLLRHRRALAAARNPRSYVLAALRHRAHALRERRGESLTGDEFSAPAGEQRDDLWRAVDRLSVEQRAVVTLRIEDQLGFAEIGQLLGISPNTASSRYRYALEHLREELGGASDD